MTEYRMISKHTIVADTYLQFKSKKKTFFGKEKEVWRYVPEESPAAVFGWYLSEEDCPASLSFFNESYLISSFSGQENFLNGPIAFTKKYPDINKYFEFLEKKRKEYLLDLSKKKPEGTIIPL